MLTVNPIMSFHHTNLSYWSDMWNMDCRMVKSPHNCLSSFSFNFSLGSPMFHCHLEPNTSPQNATLLLGSTIIAWTTWNLWCRGSYPNQHWFQKLIHLPSPNLQQIDLLNQFWFSQIPKPIFFISLHHKDSLGSFAVTSFSKNFVWKFSYLYFRTPNESPSVQIKIAKVVFLRKQYWIFLCVSPQDLLHF